MKKIIYMTVAALLTLSSCDMDLEPQGAIPDTEALITVTDYERFVNGLNAEMRSYTSGDYVILSDIQLDDFNAVIGNGNRRMDFYNGQILPSTGEIGSIYSGYYAMIAQVNFFLDHAVSKIGDKSLTPADAAHLKYYTGQAYFFRAYCYSCLADKFCQSYKNCAERNNAGTGLSLQLTYSPTADNSTYPGRSSLVDTYGQIVSDLNNAMNLITDYENYIDTKPTANNCYVNSDAAKALLARVYLNMGEDAKAASIAKEVIDSNRYDLVSNKKAFHEMWFRDASGEALQKFNTCGSEIIWKVSSDFSHTGFATGSAFCNNDKNPDYVPNNDAVYLFEEDDNRWYAWFENDDSENKAAKQFTIQNSGGNATMFLFAKYPGNPSLQPAGANGSNFINMSKPLRIGEIYLIAAEAYANMNQETEAKNYLELLEVARNTGHNIKKLSGSELIEEIYNERHRELMGEGLRQADLKRWNIGFRRSDAFDDLNNVIISNYRNIQYAAGDYRLTWPIPQHEMDTNPQLAGQQNPGY